MSVQKLRDRIVGGAVLIERVLKHLARLGEGLRLKDGEHELDGVDAVKRGQLAAVGETLELSERFGGSHSSGTPLSSQAIR